MSAPTREEIVSTLLSMPIGQGRAVTVEDVDAIQALYAPLVEEVESAGEVNEALEEENERLQRIIAADQERLVDALPLARAALAWHMAMTARPTVEKDVMRTFQELLSALIATPNAQRARLLGESP